jgi:hypothetical protein
MSKKIKITQEKAVFYILWKEYQTDPEVYVPAWRFLGELAIPELNQYFFMSYKTPANGVNVVLNNPDLFERRQTTGKSGAKYFEYRIAPNPSIEKIRDEKIIEFYKLIKSLQK